MDMLLKARVPDKAALPDHLPSELLAEQETAYWLVQERV